MTNPFNQSRFRNEHELGTAYRIVSEIHDQLDTIHYLVQNLKGVRSGNIELKSDEEGKIYWKYVKSEEWVLWGDMNVWFAPLVEDLQQGQANQSDSIDSLQSQLNALDQKLDADIDVLAALTDTVQTDRNDLDTLTQQVGQNTQDISTLTQQIAQITQDISTIQGEIQTLVDDKVAFEARVSALEGIVTDYDTRFQGIESRLEALEDA